jgi:hypothetical protein
LTIGAGRPVRSAAATPVRGETLFLPIGEHRDLLQTIVIRIMVLCQAERQEKGGNDLVQSGCTSRSARVAHIHG